MEVIGRVTREDKKNEKFFTLILKYLQNLKTTKSLRKLREEFIFQTLVLLGFWPKGRIMDNPDKILENVVEREINSIRVGKKLLS
jgi:hypothetical protein